MADVLNFESNNFLGYLDSRWVLENCVLTSDGLLQINAGGVATLELVEEVQSQFAYMKVVAEFSDGSISPENQLQE